MQVAIFGHHPDLFPGFNSLMTANLAYGFATLGHEVTVLLPETPSHPQTDRMNALKLSLDTLDQFGESITFKTIVQGKDIGIFDLGIWQSYFADDEPFFPEFRKGARIIAKNFPRLLTGDCERDTKTLLGSANRFDIVALSLKADKSLAYSLCEAIPDAVSRSIYMPRGFREDWFIEPKITGKPIFGIEKGVDTDATEYSYLVPIIEKLRSEFGEIDVIGARLNDPSITTSTLGLLPARAFYERFLNPLWAYLMIDVNRSRQSMNAVTVSGKTIYPGLYENQVVEAQLAGAAVLGHEDALPDELVASARVGFRFSDFHNHQEIFDFLAEVIENRESIAMEAKKWARANHSIEKMIEPLIRAL